MYRLILILISGLCLTFGEPASAQFCADEVVAPCPDTGATPDGLWPNCTCPRPDDSVCRSDFPYQCGVDTNQHLITCTCKVPDDIPSQPGGPPGAPDEPDVCTSLPPCPDGSTPFSLAGDPFTCVCRSVTATLHSPKRGFPFARRKADTRISSRQFSPALRRTFLFSLSEK
jgi:hypothetical protein